MNRRIRRRKRIWVRELTAKAKEKKRFCRRERRICPNIRHLLTNKTKKSNEGWTDIPLHGAQGEGNGDGGEEGDDGLALEYAVSSAGCPGSGSIDATTGGGVERLSPCPVYGVLFFLKKNSQRKGVACVVVFVSPVLES